jgi:hypothetical protein
MPRTNTTNKITWVIEKQGDKWKVVPCELFMVKIHEHGWEHNVRIMGHFSTKRDAVGVLMQNT